MSLYQELDVRQIVFRDNGIVVITYYDPIKDKILDVYVSDDGRVVTVAKCENEENFSKEITNNIKVIYREKLHSKR